MIHFVLVKIIFDGGARFVFLCELWGLYPFGLIFEDDAVDEGVKVVCDAEHDDVVVEVDRAQVELFPDFADLPIGESKTLLKVRLAIVLANRVLVPLPVVLYPDSFQIPLLENAVLDEIVCVVPADSLKGVVEMFANAYYFVFLEDEPVPLAFVEAFLVPEEPFLS